MNNKLDVAREALEDAVRLIRHRGANPKFQIKALDKIGEAEKSLLQSGDFILHSGDKSNFKIDCDALTGKDIESVANIIASKFKFSSVYGIPTGGVRLANALQKYCTEGPRLVVDDVLTTGNSMEETKKDGDIGAVIFARGECPDWITPIFRMI